MTFKETKIGKTPEHWDVLPIKEITKVVTDYVANGSFASLTKNVTYRDVEDVAVLIRLVDYNNDFHGKFVFIDEHAYEFLSKSKLYGNEIIISNVGSNVGTVFRCPKLQYKMSLAPNSIMVKFKENDDFYFHWLRGYNGQQMLKSIVTGSAQPKFNKTNFKEMLAPVPPIDEQNKIALILNSIDEKINLNKKINNNLEQQMQALFNEYVSSNEFDNLTTVENVVLTANTGADAIQKAPIVDYDTGIRCIRVGDMTNSRSFYEWGFTKVTDEVFKRYQLHKNDIVVTRTAALGLNTIIPEDLSAVYNNGLIRLTVDTSIMLPLYLYRQFQTEDFTNYIARIESETSVRPNMKINYLLKYEFVLPPIEKQGELIELLTPMLNQQNNLINENKKLESLRDTLLPKLMSGEIDVSTIEI